MISWQAKKRAEKAKKKSDAIPDTVAVKLIKYCTACGDPNCDFAPITIKQVGKRSECDLVAMMHPRGVFLPDIAALGIADAVEGVGIAFQPQGFAVAQLRHPLGHAQ